MKITIDIDCTPEEARRFLGLPDVAPMQEELLTEISGKLRRGLDSMEPEALFKTWLPASLQGWEQLQKQFWAGMAGAGMAGAGKAPSGGGGAGKKD